MKKLLTILLCFALFVQCVISGDSLAIYNGGTITPTYVTQLISNDGINYSPNRALTLPNPGDTVYTGLGGGIQYNNDGSPRDDGTWYYIQVQFPDGSTVRSPSYGPYWNWHNYSDYVAGIYLPGGAQSWSFGSNSAPVYTNYTYCITNTSSTLLANVTFHFKSSALQNPSLPIMGTVDITQYATLTPGGSTCFTTPQIEVSPTADVWSASLNSQTIPAPFNPGTNADGSPNISFGNNPQGGGASGTFGGTGGTPSPSGGNASPSPTGGTITNPPVFAPGTNSDVLFQAPQGLASESTLNSGFQLLHSDNINLLTGEKIINDTLTAGNLITMTMTNELGQIIANTYRIATNSDQISLLRSVTNLLGNLPTNNQVSLNLTNTGLTLTNYASETTLQGISNLLGSALGDTNIDSTSNVYTSPAYTINSADTNADAALAAVQTPLVDVLNAAANASNAIPSLLGQSVPDGSIPNFVVDFGIMPGLGGVSIDMNPVTRFPWFFLFSHALFTWYFVWVFITGVVETLYKAISDYATAQTGGVPNMTGGAGGTKGTPIIEA